MAILRKRVTAPKQVAIIEDEIRLYGEEIHSIEKSHILVQRKLDSDTAAAQSLRVRIEHAKRRLAVHNRHLSDLNTLETEYNATGDEYFENIEPVSEQIERQTKEVSTLSLKREEMSEELYAMQFILSVSAEKLKSLESRRRIAKENLRKLRMAFSVLHNVPDEIWAVVFGLCLEQEVVEYSDSLGLAQIRHTPLILGQVCSVWRNIVREEKPLWRYFICAVPQASLFQKKRWDYYTSLRPSPPTLITSLHTISNGSPGMLHSSTSPSDEDFSATPHSVRLFINSESNHKNLSVRSQQSLTLHLDHNTPLEVLKQVRQGFSSVVDLTITCKGHAVLPNGYFILRTIKTLKMELDTFEPFPIYDYGDYATIREVHIQHSGVSRLRGHRKNSVFQYSMLEVLGITPPDTNWFKIIKIPSLRQLVLYAPKARDLDAPSLLRLSHHDDFQRIRELELQQWPLYDPPYALSWSIIPLVLEVAGSLRSIETIRCVQSFIHGRNFVSLVKLLTETSDTSGPSNLKKVVIDCCSGITREDCDTIAALVESLIVYV